MKNASIEFEDGLKKAFELAYFRSYKKNETDINIKVIIIFHFFLIEFKQLIIMCIVLK